jgi:hypothetical protein
MFKPNFDDNKLEYSGDFGFDLLNDSDYDLFSPEQRQSELIKERMKKRHHDDFQEYELKAPEFQSKLLLNILHTMKSPYFELLEKIKQFQAQS